ncbi:MAG: AzlC family ABC transporter permease [Huintestinicola sp.]
MRSPFLKGMCHGIPIALGYLSVSFGFGIMAVRAGLSVAEAVGISVTNLTSAGQAAGVAIIAAGGTLIEMALTQLVINLRYSLMALSLSQKLDSSFNTPRRLITAFGITDEIFAVASAQPGKITPRYMYGLIFISFIGWSSGTFLGAAAGRLLPEAFTNAMGIVLYGMFLAIIIPPARKEKRVLFVITAAALLSVLFKYVLTFVSGGFSVIICAIAASAAAALLFPVEDKEDEN